ncbi:MAG: class I SAM-dependent methyltransferase [Anaerolineales bacterium]|jgi:O-methyltransferase involved in polyketide biosynthesis
MDVKEKILLSKEQETLLITLFCKAQDNPILKDEKARQILEQVDYEFNRLKIPQKTVVMMNMRAKKLDGYTKEFIAHHPDAVILHLGCGLDSRCLRVERRETIWYDLDLADVIELRRMFYPESKTYCMIASSVSDPTWLEQVAPLDRPVLVVAEGLFMYLQESEVHDLILRLHQKFPGCHLVFDAFSKLTAGGVAFNPSLRETGATVRWGIDDPYELEGWAKGLGSSIKLKEEWFFSQSPDIDRLSWFNRFMFHLTAPISTVQKAHRILYYYL